MLGSQNNNLKDQKENEKKPDTVLTGDANWEKIRAEWLKIPNNKPKQFAKSKTVSESYRPDIHEIIRSVKSPYTAFSHNISLEDMVDLLLEVWSEDEDN